MSLGGLYLGLLEKDSLFLTAAAAGEGLRRAFYYNHPSCHPVVDFNELGLTRRGHVKGETYFNLGRIRAEKWSRGFSTATSILSSVHAIDRIARRIMGNESADARTWIEDSLWLGSSLSATLVTLLSCSARTRLLRGAIAGAAQIINVGQVVFWAEGVLNGDPEKGEPDRASQAFGIVGLIGLVQMFGLNFKVRRELKNWAARTESKTPSTKSMSFRVVSSGPVASFQRWGGVDPTCPQFGRPTDYSINVMKGDEAIASINVTEYADFPLPLFGIDTKKQGGGMLPLIRRELREWAARPDSGVPNLDSYVTEVGGVVLMDRKLYSGTLRLAGQRISAWLPYHRVDIHSGGVVAINRVTAIIRPDHRGLFGLWKNWRQSRQDHRLLEGYLAGVPGANLKQFVGNGPIAEPLWNPDGVPYLYQLPDGSIDPTFAGYREAATFASKRSFRELPRVAMGKTPSFAQRF